MPAHNPPTPKPIKLPVPALVTSLILIAMILFSAISHPEIARSSPKGQQPIPDIAITRVQAAVSSVNRGQVVKIDITAANLGTSQESFEIQLHDETDGRGADSVGVTGDAGQIIALTLQWDTSGVSPVVHDLRATAELAGDENPNNNTLGPALLRIHRWTRMEGVRTAEEGGGSCRRFWGRRWRSAVAVLSEMAG